MSLIIIRTIDGSTYIDGEVRAPGVLATIYRARGQIGETPVEAMAQGVDLIPLSNTDEFVGSDRSFAPDAIYGLRVENS